LIRQSWLFAAFFSLASTTLAQTPPTIIHPAGKYVITTPGATSVTYTATSVTLSWEAPESPPAPPTPAPSPVPTPPPAPAPVPVPRIVGHEDVILLYPTSVSAASLSMAATLSLTLQDARVYAVSATSPAGSSWLKDEIFRGFGAPLPGILITTRNGNNTVVLCYAAKLPETDYDIAALVQQTRKGQ
jgi:hypothetical protein